jgi:hypothetical protein
VKLFLCIILTLLNLSLYHANFTQQPWELRPTRATTPLPTAANRSLSHTNFTQQPWELLANARYNAAANRPNRPSRVVANVNRAEGKVAGRERTAQVFRV